MFLTGTKWFLCPPSHGSRTGQKATVET